MRLIDTGSPLPPDTVHLDRTPTDVPMTRPPRREGAPAVIARAFPKWIDGRAYSQAVLLRGQSALHGRDHRATGEVLIDMLPLLRRCGFDTAQLLADQSADAARPFARLLPGRTTRPTRRIAHAHDVLPSIAWHAKTRGFEARVAHAEARCARPPKTTAAARAGQQLGVEGMVLTAMAARQELDLAVATLDTGTLHAQTLALIPRIRARYGIEVGVFRPRDEAVMHFVTAHGERAMFDSVRRCAMAAAPSASSSRCSACWPATAPG